MRKKRMALHQLGQDHDGDDQAVQSDGLAQGDEDQALTEGLFVLAVGCDSGRRSGSDVLTAARLKPTFCNLTF